MDKSQQHNALLLTGGGARAAYQVGVLKSIASYLPRNHGIPFPIICGTSAGAINSTALACYASCFHLGVKKLEWVWKNFKTSQIYRSDALGVYGYLLGNCKTTFTPEKDRQRATSLFNNEPLKGLLSKVVDFYRIDRNLLSGHLKAVSVTASSYKSGNSISFFQGDKECQNWQRAKRQGLKTLLNVDHLMASAAIPLVFPTIRIKDEFYGDGSVHQLSPTSPAIHLGADKILVIGVEQPEGKGHHQPHYPSSATIAGHLLDTIFADTLNSDIERLRRINGTLDLLNKKQRAQSELRNIETLVINPSRNFNEIANKYYQDMPRTIRNILRLAGVNRDSESSLLSYLMFERNFCQELIAIGYKDGLDNQASVRAFLDI